MAGARVLFTSAPAPLPDIAALTGEDGTFTLSVPVPGKYELAVHAEGFVPAGVHCNVHGADAETVRVALRTSA